MPFLDKEGLAYLWNHVVARLNGKVEKTEFDAEISAIEERIANIPTSDADVQIDAHNIDAEAHSDIRAMLDAKAGSDHSHNDLYYTETEVDNKFTQLGEALVGVLDEKADTEHAHDGLYDALGTAQEKADEVRGELEDMGESFEMVITGMYGEDVFYDESTETITTIRDVANSEATVALDAAKEYTNQKTSSLASTSSVTTSINTHNTAGDAHNDIRLLITGLTTRLNTLADSDDTTLDQMSEIVAYIKANKSLIDGITTSKVNVADIVNNLTSNVTNKPLSAAQGVAIKGLIDALQQELDEHGHEISDVNGLQTALDGKAGSSHGTHVTWSTTTPKINGTAAVGSETKVARGDHVHPTDTTRAAKADFDSHDSNTTKHVTATERTNWNAAKTHADSAHAPSNAEKNQNAFGAISVGGTEAIYATEPIGGFALDAENGLGITFSQLQYPPIETDDGDEIEVGQAIKIYAKDASTSAKGVVQLTNSTSSTSTTTAATPNSVKSAYDLANTAKTNAATAQTKADNAYALADSKMPIVTTSGTSSAYTATIDGVTELTNGMTIVLIPHVNSAANATLNINDLGAKNIYYKPTNGSSLNSMSLITGGYQVKASSLIQYHPVILTYSQNLGWFTDITHPYGSDIKGYVPVSSGGTGRGSLTAGSFVVGNGTSNVQLKTPAEALEHMGITATAEAINNMPTEIANKAPMYTYGTADLEAGVSELPSGTLYFVYE